MIVHGQARRKQQTQEYETWCEMKRRCFNKKFNGFHLYGGRGITICDRWKTFNNFFADMGLKPSPAHTLDRRDGNKGYWPDNCRWATSTEQNRNRRNCVMVSFEGKLMTVIEASERSGIKSRTLYSRLKRRTPGHLFASPRRPP